MSTLRITRPLVVAAAIVAAAPMVASSQEARSATDTHAVAARPVGATLRVENNNWLDVHLYLVRDGSTTSIGFMNGPGTDEFELPRFATIPGADVQILVLPIGGTASYLSPSVVVDRGDVVDLSIENDLALSRVIVSPKG